MAEGVDGGNGQHLLHLPSPLLELLSNSIVRDNVYLYLPLASKFALSRTSRAFRDLIIKDPQAFRYLDLSRCRGAYVPASITRIDTGGHSWRAERMDENLTEDEFYAGPLRGTLSKLNRLNILTHLHTLILDGLLSVTVDLLSELVHKADYNIRILSVRDCPNLNQRRLQQLLRHICRPGRPEGTPKLRGLYVFGEERSTNIVHDSSNQQTSGSGVMEGEGVLGTAPSTKSRHHPSTEVSPWYSSSGKVLRSKIVDRHSWNETLQFCKGIIAFDAVLCLAMHRALEPYLHEASKDHLRQHNPTIPPIANIALGPHGCEGCGFIPSATPVWGETNISEFPLLSPPPYSGKLLDAVRPPPQTLSPAHADTPYPPARLIVSCPWCLANRYCEACHRWWCGTCFDPKRLPEGYEHDIVVRHQGEGYMVDTFNADTSAGRGAQMGNLPPAVSDWSGMKVFNNLCVEYCLVPEMMCGAGSGGMWG